MWGVIVSYSLGFVLSIVVFSRGIIPPKDIKWAAVGWMIAGCLIIGLLWPAWVIIYVNRGGGGLDG